jgi:hypothetical protein
MVEENPYLFILFIHSAIEQSGLVIIATIHLYMKLDLN